MATKESLKVQCRQDGCAESFHGVSAYNARRRHEAKAHPGVKLGPTLKPAKRRKTAKSKSRPVSEVRVTMEGRSKDSETVVPVVLNFCPFCARALPNAHLIQNGRH